MLKEEKHLAALIEKAHRKTVRDKWHRGGKFSGIKPLSSGDKGQIMETFAICSPGSPVITHKQRRAMITT